MRKFSDIPQFILKEYITKLQEEVLESVVTSDIIWKNVLFQDREGFLWTDNTHINWNLTYSIGDKSSQEKSYLTGPSQCIFTRGGEKINAYVETDEKFQEINLVPMEEFEDREEDWVGTYYNFKILDSKYPVPSDEIKYELEGESYHFIQYDIFSDPEYKTVDQKSGWEVYIRNDNSFFEWASQYSDHLNLNQYFIFLGNIFPYSGYDWRCKIFRYLLKDFVINILPENNRTDKLVEFFDNSIDQVYNKVYSSMKHLKNLYDADEIQSGLIDRVSGFYNLTTSGYSDKERMRNLVRTFPTLLKKKGTYSALFSVWKLISGFVEEKDSNSLNVYEWWHDSLPSGTYSVPSSGWDVINYLNQYGDIDFTSCSGEEYYEKYTRSYPDFYSTNLFTSVKDTSIHKQEEESIVWEVSHFLNDTELLVQCYNDDYEEINPSNTVIQDSSVVRIEFSKDTKGFCLLSRVNYGTLKNGNFWDIDHYINKRSILTQSFTSFNERFYPKNIVRDSRDSSTITLNQTEGHGYFLDGDYIYYNLEGSEEWEIDHGLYELLITQVYDIDDNIIMPKSVKHEGLVKTVIKFSKPTTGYVVMKAVGKVDLDRVYGKILSPYYTVEGDLTCKPIDDDKILSQSTGENLVQNWEEMRGITRVPDYSFVFAPISDFSGSVLGTYSQQYTPYWLTSCILGKYFKNVSTFAQNVISTEWNISHLLKTDQLLVFVYDKEYRQIYPSSIEILDSFNVRLNFDAPQDGYVVLLEGDSSEEFGTNYTLNHSFDRNIITQLYNLDRTDIVFPEKIKYSSDLVEVEGSEDSVLSYTEGTFVLTQTEPTSAWEIDHGLNTTGIIVQFFNSDWERMFPESVSLPSTDTCLATFSEPVSGYGVLKEAQYLDYKNDIITDLTTNGCYAVFGSGTDKDYIQGRISGVQDRISEKYINNTEIYSVNNNLFIDIELDDEVIRINEIGIFDKDKEQLYFYSQGSEIYKSDKYRMTIHFRIMYEDL